jgi:hypothetical protein
LVISSKGVKREKIVVIEQNKATKYSKYLNETKSECYDDIAKTYVDFLMKVGDYALKKIAPRLSEPYDIEKFEELFDDFVDCFHLFKVPIKDKLS